jgi:hypothetical protein
MLWSPSRRRPFIISEIRGISGLSTSPWYVLPFEARSWNEELISQCPIHTKLVLPDLLTESERTWLNSYHDEVKEKVTPILREFGDNRALQWLEKECKPI